MKILHVDPAGTWRGGERQVYLLARELQTRGVDCVVAAAPLHSPLAERTHAAGVRVFPCAMRSDLDPAATWRLRALVRRERPDLVHLHTARAHAVGGLATRWAGNGTPILVTRRVELPVKGLLGRWKYSALADHYVAISEAVAASLRSGGVPESRISRIPSGVELPARPSAPPDGAAWTVGTLAAMSPQKDPDTWARTAIRTVKEDPDIRFVWAGDGELRGTLEGAIREAGVQDRVEILPFLEDPEPVWKRLSAFFLPSAFEALGTVLLDAMARELPIVATRVGGIPEVVRDGVEGLLAAPGDDVALSAALRRLRGEPELGARLGGAGRARAGEYEIGGIVERIAALYETMLRGRAS